jgi:hypothetical protein
MIPEASLRPLKDLHLIERAKKRTNLLGGKVGSFF